MGWVLRLWHISHDRGHVIILMTSQGQTEESSCTLILLSISCFNNYGGRGRGVVFRF